MSSRIQKTVFISYRREHPYHARAVYQDLIHNGYDVYMDVEGINSGSFEQIILTEIQEHAHFLIVLTPTALDRCNKRGDWLRREIEHAIDCERNIVPLMFDNFVFGTQAVKAKLTRKLRVLDQFNALEVSAGYFEDSMDRLRNRYLKVALKDVLRPLQTSKQITSPVPNDPLKQASKELVEIVSIYRSLGKVEEAEEVLRQLLKS